MSCHTCGGRDLTVVGFEAVDGAKYRYCRLCESGWWECDGQEIAVTSILEAAASIEPVRRRSVA